MAESKSLDEGLKQAAAVIARLKARIAKLEQPHEPIAIVGLGCRYPGGIVDPETFWGVLERGVDAVTEMPRERWDVDALYDPDPDAAGKMTTRSGGFLTEIDRFDAGFFGISPREAVAMDPQQRLLLETSWEALERAGITADALVGSSTGVFVGLMYQEYGTLSGLSRLDGYVGTGSTASIASGRISYVLGLQGPSLTVDTACSSSLVTVHLACQALQSGECTLALAGGVALMVTPATFVEFSRLRGLSPDGRCKSFAASADGTGWSEGCGMVVLERLSDARRNGHRVLGVIRGSAVNQDGRSNGLTAPNGPSQEAVIRRALAQAGVRPAEVGYVECHGTGTVLGDPIEVQALGSVLAEGRDPSQPVIIGSLKSNLGHTQAAAGVAGLIKVVLSMQHGQIPKNLHFDAPSPHIEWDALPVQVASEPMAWKRNGAARLAGVSSFGLSGTNAHVVIEEAPVESAAVETPARSAELVVLSAKSAAALEEMAQRLAAHVKEHAEQSLGDVAYSLATTRSHHEHRLSIVAATREALVSGLEAAARRETVEGSSRGHVGKVKPKVVFVFPGQGSQWLGMGRELSTEEPAFREALEKCSAAIEAETGWSVIDELGQSAETSRLESLDVVQPVLFSVEVALAALWRSWGVEPDVVVGHSMGEVAAAHVAGALTLADAAKVICRRSRLMKRIRGQGEMALVQLPAEDAKAALSGYEDRVSVAVSNSRRSTVLSGEPAALGAVLSKLEGQGVFCKRVKVDVASHSPQVDVLREELLSALSELSPQALAVAMRSTVTGQRVEDRALGAAYWVDNLRQPVRLAEVMEGLLAEGHSVFVELSPHPVLLPALEELVGDSAIAGTGTVTGSLYRDRPERASMLAAAGKLHVVGAPLGLKRLYGQGKRVDLPTYAWDRQRYWLEGSRQQGRSGEATGHPLLGDRVSLAGGKIVYETVLSRVDHAWLYDHRVGEAALMPAAGLAELARAAGEHCLGDAVEVVSLVLPAPLVLPEYGGRRVQVLVSVEEDRTEVTLHSQPVDASGSAHTEWTLHASGEVRQLNAVPGSGVAPRLDLVAVRSRCAEAVELGQAYEELAQAGILYGPAFRGLQKLWVGKDEALAEVVLPDSALDASLYGIHPALLDAAFQSVLGLADRSSRHLPFAMEQMVVHAAGTTAAWVHARRRSENEASEGLLVDVTLSDAQGEVLVEVSGLRVRPAKDTSLQQQAGEVGRAIHRVGWSKVAAPAEAKLSGRWAVVADEKDATAAAVVDRLRHAGAECVVVDAEGLAAALPADHVVALWSGGGKEDGDAAAAHRLASAGLSMVQLLAKQERAPRLWWVTRGAMAVTEAEGADVAQAPLWGLGRTVMQEHPELNCTLVDAEDAAAVVRELGAVDEEREIAWRAGERYAARLKRRGGIVAPEAENYALSIQRKGALDDLALHPAPRRRPERGEVEIEVRMAGLNFRDVLSALGMLPRDFTLGGECSGIVTAVGEGVSAIAVGDRVMALAPECFGRYTVTDARAVARIPEGLSFAQAATIPVTFLTAWYGLFDLAGLEAGERLLVHAAAGGVGIAAVQIARSIGAEVVATASPAKWDLVRALGVQTIGNSRDLSFVETIRGATGGAGVDVVLNSLSGSFVEAGLSLLGPGGRFIEMGKTDIRDASAVSASHPGVYYRAFDLVEAGWDRLGEMLASIVEGFEAGHFTPMPVQTFPLTEAEAAFRFMAQARHVGKIVIAPPRALRTDGTVLITGGLGELGLHVARWLAQRGVPHLVLTGRRGLSTPGAAEAVAELEAAGARVTVSAVDVSDRAALRGVLAAIPPELPLRGVVHAAGALDDAVLSDQSAERFARVMRPKVDGACHLDALTRDADLDVFVLFSSIAGTLGSAGQGGYAAANACLDALAARRRASGLAGQSLAWGLWVDASSQAAGLASGLDRVQQSRLKKNGLGAIDPVQGTALMAAVHSLCEAQLVLTPLDLGALRRRFGETVPPLWQELVRVTRRAATASRGAWASELAVLSEKERQAAVLGIVQGEVARVLSLPGSDAASPDRPLKELGLDSLMAVELRNALGRRAGARLPATLAFDHPTPAAIAKFLLEKVLSLSKTSTVVVTSSATPQTADEPIAIVGIGCRFPGGIVDPETFWGVLEGGVDAVTEMPRERWDVDALYDPDPDAAGKMTTRSGGFVPGIDRFDAGFFGISPREAANMDPQQRLLLETSWEALERAGIAAETLVGTSTGVFVGMSYQEYSTLVGGLSRLDGYVGTGSLPSVASGRISYVLGLQGPSLTVDTACSSSLVTVHLACQALRSGECSMALAGGVSLMLTAGTFVEFSRLRGLSPDGRCKSFAASADGTGWSEGCGMVVLERLSDARRNGHRVLAVVRGSAVNQDGRSNGLTAPNGPSQEAVIRRALAQAGVRPSEVGYVECHGTGTVLGDPIEVQALGAVLAEGREPSRPVIIGSLKSNLGHTQAAAGVAGLIKVVLSMQHGQIPKSLHFDAPSPHIAWDALPVQVASEAVAWKRNGAARLAGVSAFGISGTNAHVVIEEAPVESAAVETPARSAELVVLSAKSGVALEEMAQRLLAHVKGHEAQSLGDVAYSLATTRSHHEQRLSIVAATREALVSSLEAAARGEQLAGTSRGAARTSGKTAWLFTGQGSQTIGMGRGLSEEWPAFREAFDAACAALDPHLEAPLREVMWNEPSSRLDETGFTQPALFALQVGLSALWRSWGVEPDVVAGHSIGEVAAAYVAGVFSLDDAARLVAARGRLMQALPRIGAMVAIDASEAEVVKALAGRSGVSIAAVNGPTSVVISGVEEAVLAVSSAFAARGVRTKRLTVSHAFHSPLMDPMLDEFRRVAEAIAYRPAQIVVVSNVSGQAAGDELSTAAYWVKHVREAVRFAAGIASLHASGVREYLEIGPRPTLLGLVPACLPTAGNERANEPVLVASLRAERPESATILEALGAHHVHGGRVQWEGVFAAGGKRVDLPTYAWDRQRYWLEESLQQGRSGEATGHPLLGDRVSLAGGKIVYETVLSRGEHAWLYDHRVGDAALMPGAGLAELVRAAGEQCLGEAASVVSLVLPAPLVLPEHGGRRVQVLVSVEEDRTEVTVHSQPVDASGSAHAEWTLHASGEVRPLGSDVAARFDRVAVRSRCAEAVDVAQAYEELTATGMIYGPAFRGLQKLWVGNDEVLAEVVLPDGVLEASLYGIHPALLDAAFQTVLGLGDRSSVHLPFAMEQVVVHAAGTTAAWVHARRRAVDDASEGLVVDVTLSDAHGDVLVEVSGLRMLPAKETSRQSQARAIGNAIHHVGWSKVAAPAEAKPSGRWVVVAEPEDAMAAAVVDRLRRAGAECIVADVDGLVAALPADHVVALWSRRDEGEDGDAEAAHRLASAGLSMVQLLAKQERAPRLWWVTRCAMSLTAAEPGDVALAPLWGLGRTVMQEHPELDCTLLDVEDAAALVRELGAGDEEREVAWRAGERYVARLKRASAIDVEARALRTDGTVLITGGLGALGLHVARWLSQRGVPHLVLTGRRGLANVPGAADAVRELEASGARVTVAAVDVSDRAALRDLLATIPPELPLRGVVHAAGALDDGALSSQSAERFARVMGPKVDGACHLDALTREADLDVFVLFSSIAGTLGSAGQGGYAAANAFLDALAARRRASGLAGQSLAWGLWVDASSQAAGLASGLDRAQQARLAKSGLGAIDPALGMALMAAAVSRSEAQLVLTPLELGVLRRRFGEMVPPLWRELVRAPRRAAARGAWARELALLAEKEQQAAVLAMVRGEVARALSLPSGDAVDPDRPLRELGLDSLMGVELRSALGRRAGAQLPATLAFDHPTPASIAKYLLEKVLLLSKTSPVVVTPGVVADEPIAIVGMGCRYPGGIVDPETFWGVLEGGVDAVKEMPRERWDVDALYDPDPDAAGKMTTRSGGFVTPIDQFDAGFFGISPREAVAMDPQQRLLLETSWEALERAGIASETLVGSSTGVFVGLMYQEYGARSGLDRLDGYIGTGTAASIASGRISYVLGLQGPSLTVDTACSSSLVTMHLACQALRAGECTLALAGGVALMLTPTTFVEFSRLRGLSSDGRCKSFAASADGTGWSEGCGMLVLERLSDARRNGHRVLGVIRGSAVNQDGRSNGLTAPNGPSQEAVIRRALAQAGVRPADVGYVECHGTGTVLGDPIEVQALGAVLAEGRDPSRPVIIGSVKSNLAHTQAAAGVAGVIKVVLSMQHGQIPKSLHFDAPSPHIAWDALPVRVASEPVAWVRNGAARLAGVSSFGVSGTNAHVVIEEAPVESAAVETPARSRELMVLSAKSGAALEEMAQRLAAHVKAHEEQSLGDVAYSLAMTRSHHEHRLSIVAATRESLVSSLEAAARGELSAASRGVAGAGGKAAWLFTGQGSQYLGMGRGLSEEWPAFREAFDAACAALDPHLEAPLREVMWNEPSSRLDETGFTQPALFALQVGLSALWRSWGVEPDVVAGHSIGEVAAAYVAGVFSLEDAARLAAFRGRLMQALPRIGAMVAIDASEAEVVKALAGRSGVSIAAVNGPSSIVISGVDDAVLAVSSAFAARGVRTKRLSVSHAFHSALMDPMLDELRRVAEAIAYQPARIPVVSNVSGRAAGEELGTAEYWVTHAREAVRFAAGIASLHASGVTEYLEIGPRPTLLGLVPACLPTDGNERASEPVLVASLRAERPESEAILEALGAHHVRGGRVRWASVFAGGKRVDLPTYAWDRQRYWIEGSLPSARSGEATGHPLLGNRVSLAGGKVMYDAVLSQGEHAWLYDHRVGDHALMPGAGLAELVRAAAEDCFGEPVAVSSLVLPAPLVLPPHGGQRVHVLVSTEEDRTEVTVHSQSADAAGSAHAEWTLHASGEVTRLDAEAPRLDLAALRSRCAKAVDVGQAYDELAAAGMSYGPAFRGLKSLRVGKDEALGEVMLPDGAPRAEEYGIHPALLDAAFHAVLGLSDRSTRHLPFVIDQVVVHAVGTTAAWVHVRTHAKEEASEGLVVDVTLSDAHGEVLVEVTGLRVRPLKEISLHQAAAGGRAIHVVGWSKVAAPAEAKLSGRWLVVAEPDDAMARSTSLELVDRLRRAGAECITVDGDGLSAALPADHVIGLWSPAAEQGDAEAAHRVASAGLTMVQRLAKEERPPRLWWVTRGAMSVTAAEPGDVAQASLWGLGRTVMQEHPELNCTLVDAEDAAAIVRELGAVDEEREIAWRAGERYVARLRRPAAADLEPRALRTDGTVLITGGLGALGMHVARWLAQRGVPHLVLTGRRGLANVPGAAEAVAELEAAGARVTVSAVDVSDGAALRGVLAAIPPELPLRGVVHAAGVLDDAVLSEQSAERFARVMGPKVDGACHLDALTRQADLDVFVLFSSIAGTLGSAGQGGYAAANACLDALAARRRASGLAGQSLAWGPWLEASPTAGAGMASGLDRVQRARLKKSGLGAIDAVQGMALMASALSRSDAQLVLTPLELGVLRRRFGEMVPPLWRELVRVPRRAAAAAARGAWASELALLSEKERQAAVLAMVCGEVARALSLPSGDAVEPQRPLKELGFDSLMVVQLRNALGRRAGAPLPATLAFDYPTPAAIAKYLLEKVLSPSVAPPAAPLPAPRPMEQEALQTRITEIDQLSQAELEDVLKESMRRAAEEFGL